MHSFLELEKFDKIWFSSDWHLGHDKMAQYGNPAHRIGLPDQAAMDKHIVDTVNETCGPNDVLFLLGDVSFHNKANTAKLMNSIAVNMALVIGNHDWDLTCHDVNFVRRFMLLADNVVQKLPDGETVFLSHFPHLAWPKMRQGWYHLHGHLHGEPYEHPGRIMDVGWDLHGRPISWEEVKAGLQTRPPIAHHTSSVPLPG